MDVVGDKWTLLVIRDAMDGARSFTELQRRTGIARNILTDRLRKLVASGILTRQAAPSGKRQEYLLTDAGHDLFPVIVGLRQWGERHAFLPHEDHSVLLDSDGRSLARLLPTTVDGAPASDTTTTVHKVT
ncbi:MAG: helix-turn-helix domain-containing protein [Microbacterium enclense]